MTTKKKKLHILEEAHPVVANMTREELLDLLTNTMCFVMGGIIAMDINPHSMRILSTNKNLDSDKMQEACNRGAHQLDKIFEEGKTNRRKRAELN